MTPSQQLYTKLRENGIDFFVSVPCKYLAELISIVEQEAAQDKEVTYTPVTREEEGIGVCAGAYLAGRKPAILMQNSGLGNSINAICSLLNLYDIPITMVVSHRGTAGEKIDAQIPMGRAAKGLLETARVGTIEIPNQGELRWLRCAERESVALLFPISYWGQP